VARTPNNVLEWGKAPHSMITSLTFPTKNHIILHVFVSLDLWKLVCKVSKNAQNILQPQCCHVTHAAFRSQFLQRHVAQSVITDYDSYISQ